MVIGLTGGTASGQTTVGKIMAEKGAFVISADKLSKKIIDDDPDIRKKLITAFGNKILDDDGKLNRRKLGEIVFLDADALETLDSIVHPVLLNLLKLKIEQAKKEHEIIVVDAALLVEAEILDWFDKIIVVYADVEKRLRRVIERDNLSRDIAMGRINSQIPLKEKIKFADYVIDNNHTIVRTIEQVDEIWIDIFGE
jgi:dephospho-CoA kinase